ncbi:MULTISPECIES: signal peptidase I [unclassified Pseudonocardia]|uniref:signal peptidase I n=1 Tax=unclassified Pseudonocardia TaxID=2619320 RepID=UPI00095C0501|nr:signal peptidase I [Pseudonocardia sp. Ae707_Ps1]OLM17173.1 Signal peptidase I [Pseudonocardia sp. Ae707_Ps1]
MAFPELPDDRRARPRRYRGSDAPERTGRRRAPEGPPPPAAEDQDWLVGTPLHGGPPPAGDDGAAEPEARGVRTRHASEADADASGDAPRGRRYRNGYEDLTGERTGRHGGPRNGYGEPDPYGPADAGPGRQSNGNGDGGDSLRARYADRLRDSPPYEAPPDRQPGDDRRPPPGRTGGHRRAPEQFEANGTGSHRRGPEATGRHGAADAPRSPARNGGPAGYGAPGYEADPARHGGPDGRPRDRNGRPGGPNVQDGGARHDRHGGRAGLGAPFRQDGPPSGAGPVPGQDARPSRRRAAPDGAVGAPGPAWAPGRPGSEAPAAPGPRRGTGPGGPAAAPPPGRAPAAPQAPPPYGVDAAQGGPAAPVRPPGPVEDPRRPHGPADDAGPAEDDLHDQAPPTETLRRPSRRRRSAAGPPPDLPPEDDATGTVAPHDLDDDAGQAGAEQADDGTRRAGKRSGPVGAGAKLAAMAGLGKGPDGEKQKLAFWKELLLLAGVALLLTVLIQTFLAKVYVIPSGSMETTLHGCTGCTNDRVLVDKVTYNFTDVSPGDIVVFRGTDGWASETYTGEGSANPLVKGLQTLGSLVGVAPPDEKDFVKRVIAVGGQTVACCDALNQVMVDGQPLEEPYVYYLPEAGPARQIPFGPITVPEGEYWMMGDSRNNSADSRAAGHGPIPEENIIGKVRLIVLPFDRFGWVSSSDPQTTAEAAGAPGLPDGLPLALGIMGTLPLAAGRRRTLRARADAERFLPDTRHPTGWRRRS